MALPSHAVSPDFEFVRRIEAAMEKIAEALPHDSDLGLVWERLEGMHAEAITMQTKRTETQSRASKWLARQKDISLRSFATSANDNPAP